MKPEVSKALSLAVTYRAAMRECRRINEANTVDAMAAIDSEIELLSLMGEEEATPEQQARIDELMRSLADWAVMTETKVRMTVDAAERAGALHELVMEAYPPLALAFAPAVRVLRRERWEREREAGG